MLCNVDRSEATSRLVSSNVRDASSFDSAVYSGKEGKYRTKKHLKKASGRSWNLWNFMVKPILERKNTYISQLLPKLY